MPRRPSTTFADRARRRLRIQHLQPREMLDASAPAILQVFESTYGNLEYRAADIFAAGYGGVWIPPTGRADSGSFSVGYDAYNRFDLGGPGAPTLYGTESGLKTLVDVLHTADVDVYADFVINHNGFRDSSTPGFIDEGGYPGFVLTLNPGNNNQGYNDIDGDFHSAFDGGDLNGRLSGLIDIAHDRNYAFIRQPVDGSDSRNIPAGPIANQPNAANARFYPDTSLDPIMVFDPVTGESDIAIYPYNESDPGAGDATPENALGYLMRNARWLVETIGVDGLRVDAAKHVEPWVLEYLDRAVYRAIDEPQLDGSTKHPFLFLEAFTGDKGQIQGLIRKDINPNDPGRIGGNRDALDFPLFFALKDNLTGNGFANDWRNIKNASQDSQDDGLANNGSQGVAFASSHDEHGAFLDNVAHAYVLMRPGNAIVYLNAKQFGDGRDFPKDGRGDSLGGLFGDTITKLVGIRNSHGRGDYIDRTPSSDEKEMLLFERSGSSLTLLSNRIDGGFDSRTVQTNFLPGTPLVELTGNAANPVFDPFNDFPEVVVVKQDGTVDVRVPRNTSPSGTQHNSGYLIYGPSGPQTSLAIGNVAFTLNADDPTSQTNGTSRLNDIEVITEDTFEVTLNTARVNHLGSVRDSFADGDNALLKIDSGVDLNGNGVVDFASVGGPSSGFETFVTQSQPGYLEDSGNGLYRQVIDTSTLGEGLHFLETRAFRHREPGEGDAIYTSNRKSIYVDQLPPESEIASFEPRFPGVDENRALRVRMADRTGDNVHVFWNLPAALSDSNVLAMVSGESQANRIDRDLFEKDINGLVSGNHVATVVTYEITGNVNVQRFPGLGVSTVFGAGLGDLDFDGDVDANDVGLFSTLYNSSNTQFSPAADFNADGLINVHDLPLFFELLVSTGNTGATLQALDGFVVAEELADFGDASETHATSFASDGPRHIVVARPFLGSSVDTDPDGQPTLPADGDDNDEVDDENGVVALGQLIAGQSASIAINASSDAKLDVWIDFNGNRMFDHPSEHLGGGQSIDVEAGDNDLVVNVPEDAVADFTTMRLRISSLGNLSPTGLAGDGEVEDHLIELTSRPSVEAYVVNEGDEQRSTVSSVEIVFDRVVQLSGDATELIRRGSGQVVTGWMGQTRVENGRTIAQIMFGEDPFVQPRTLGNSLLDGNYQLTVRADLVTDPATNLNMAADDVFGDEAADAFFRRYGDLDGDRDVDGLDYSGFAGTFLRKTGDAAFRPALDYDGDGDVDGIDYGEFANRFLRPMRFE